MNSTGNTYSFNRLKLCCVICFGGIIVICCNNNTILTMLPSEIGSKNQNFDSKCFLIWSQFKSSRIPFWELTPERFLWNFAKGTTFPVGLHRAIVMVFFNAKRRKRRSICLASDGALLPLEKNRCFFPGEVRITRATDRGLFPFHSWKQTCFTLLLHNTSNQMFFAFWQCACGQRSFMESVAPSLFLGIHSAGGVDP